MRTQVCQSCPWSTISNISAHLKGKHCRKISELQAKAKRSHQFNRLRDDPFSSRRVHFNLGQYHSYGEIVNYLNQLAAAYPDRAHVQSIGVTHEGRAITLIKVSLSVQ